MPRGMADQDPIIRDNSRKDPVETGGGMTRLFTQGKKPRL